MGLRKPLKRPQARGLIEGLTEAQHVIIDAGYEADNLSATALVKRNPTRREDRSVDWELYKERHLKRFALNLNRQNPAAPLALSGFWRWDVLG